MRKRVAEAELRTSLPKLLDRIEAGGEVAIARGGRTVARLVPAFGQRTHAVIELAFLRGRLASPLSVADVLALRDDARRAF